MALCESPSRSLGFGPQFCTGDYGIKDESLGKIKLKTLIEAVLRTRLTVDELVTTAGENRHSISKRNVGGGR